MSELFSSHLLYSLYASVTNWCALCIYSKWVFWGGFHGETLDSLTFLMKWFFDVCFFSPFRLSSLHLILCVIDKECEEAFKEDTPSPTYCCSVEWDEGWEGAGAPIDTHIDVYSRSGWKRSASVLICDLLRAVSGRLSEGGPAVHAALLVLFLQYPPACLFPLFRSRSRTPPVCRSWKCEWMNPQFVSQRWT